MNKSRRTRELNVLLLFNPCFLLFFSLPQPERYISLFRSCSSIGFSPIERVSPGKAMSDTNTIIEQHLLDPSVNATSKDASENYEESIKQNFPDVSSQRTHAASSLGSHHHHHHQEEQKTVAESESLNLQDLEKISHHVDETCVKVHATGISNGSSPSTGTGMTKLGHTQESWEKSAKNLYKHQRDDDDANRSLVDTTAPVESVKEVVIKFGGIIDWKAHKAHALEKHKHMCFELERIQEEIAELKRQSEAAEMAKTQVQKELEGTKQIVEELKLKLERAEKEESQARQDSEFVHLKVREIEEGISSKSSTAAEALSNDAKERLRAVVAERESVEAELKALQGECVSSMNERDIAMRKSENAAAAAKEIEQRTEELTLELISKGQLLESAHAAYLEAEEHRIGAALVRDQDCLAWENELKQAEKEVQQLNRQLVSMKDVKLKLDSSSALLLKLKAEFEAYMNERSKQECDATINDEEEAKGSLSSIRSLAPTKKALEETKTSIEKTENEVHHLKDATSSLTSEIAAEKAALNALKQREGMASVVVSSLEAELARTKQELEVIRMKEKESRERIVELPRLLPGAAWEANQAKSVAQTARDELRKAKKEAEQAKASTTTTQLNLRAILMEIEAAKASEKQALTAIEALRESEQAASTRDEHAVTAVTLPFDEYLTLSDKANEAEKLAHEKVAASLTQIESAEKMEFYSLKRLEEAYRKMARCKQALEVAVKKAEKAKDAKLEAEQELRKWRAELEQQRKANGTTEGAISPSGSSSLSGFRQRSESKIIGKEDQSGVVLHPQSSGNTEHDVIVKKKKKSVLFPRILLFLVRRKR